MPAPISVSVWVDHIRENIMMKFSRSRSRGAYNVNPPQGNTGDREVVDPLVKDEKGFTYILR